MNKKRILVVDDERYMQRLLQFILEKTGATIETAGSGEAALAVLRRRPADLVVLDLVMPGLNGFDTVRAMRKEPDLEAIPVIMLTSRGPAEPRDKAASLGIVAYFTKPFSPMELTDNIKQRLCL
jgi:CheY-like chemotaxis protein